MYNRVKELYCDTTIFVFDSLLSICQKKMGTEKWPKVADSPLLQLKEIMARSKRCGRFNKRNNFMLRIRINNLQQRIAGSSREREREGGESLIYYE